MIFRNFAFSAFKPPKTPQTVPRGALEASQTSPRLPKRAPRRPLKASGPPKKAQEGPKRAPRGLQEGLQDGSNKRLRPKWAPGPLRDSSRTHPGPLGDPSGTEFRTIWE